LLQAGTDLVAFCVGAMRFWSHQIKQMHRYIYDIYVAAWAV